MLSEKPDKCCFSIDLVENSLKHKWFLQTIHELGISLKRPSLLALQRYTDCWLPLVNKYIKTPLIPPANVAWLWHCHRLAPRDYEKYVTERFGALLDATLPFTLQYADADVVYSLDSLTTQKIWSKEFPDKMFFLDSNQVNVHVNCHNVSGENKVMVGGFDLLGSTDRQATFLWQVSSPSFDDIDFLEQGVENYRRFLLLKPMAQKLCTILVPT